MSWKDYGDKQKSTVAWEQIMVIYEYKGPSGGGYWLRIGKWVIDGNPGEPVLEKRKFYEGVNGYRKITEQSGLNKQDIYRILEKLKPIQAVMDFPIPKEFSGAFKEPDA